MYQLYYSPGACSMAVHVILNEMGQSVELINAGLHDAQKNPELVKLNPRGQVPVLVDDGKALREGAAIIAYLCDKHKSPLLPQSGWERAMALQWLMFANSSMHPAYGQGFFIKKAMADKPYQQELMTQQVGKIQAMWNQVEEHLANQPYLAGKEITAGDILLTVIANWSGNFTPAITFGPNTKKLFQSVISRPSYKAALEKENVTYKVAA